MPDMSTENTDHFVQSSETDPIIVVDGQGAGILIPENPERKFITDQFPFLDKQIKELTIMQRAYSAGGETFKPQQEDTSKKLGAWLAVKEDLQKQLAELSND